MTISRGVHNGLDTKGLIIYNRYFGLRILEKDQKKSQFSHIAIIYEAKLINKTAMLGDIWVLDFRHRSKKFSFFNSPGKMTFHFIPAR